MVDLIDDWTVAGESYLECHIICILYLDDFFFDRHVFPAPYKLILVGIGGVYLLDVKIRIVSWAIQYPIAK
jgi:hypothetical protein